MPQNICVPLTNILQGCLNILLLTAVQTAYTFSSLKKYILEWDLMSRIFYSVSKTKSVCMLSHFSHVRLCVTPWTVAHQSSLSLEFSRQQYWTGLPCPPPVDLPDPRTEPVSLKSPALAGGWIPEKTKSTFRQNWVAGNRAVRATKWLSVKESACWCRRHRFDPWVGKISQRRKWQPTPYSCLENPMDWGAWQAAVHGVTESQIWLSDSRQ